MIKGILWLVVFTAAALGIVNKNNVQKTAGISGKGKVKDVITLALEGKFNDAWTLLIELIRVYGMTEKDFLKYTNEYLSRQGLLNQGNIAEVIAKYDYRIIIGANPEIQLSALLAELGKIDQESAQNNR